MCAPSSRINFTLAVLNLIVSLFFVTYSVFTCFKLFNCVPAKWVCFMINLSIIQWIRNELALFHPVIYAFYYLIVTWLSKIFMNTMIYFFCFQIILKWNWKCCSDKWLNRWPEKKSRFMPTHTITLSFFPDLFKNWPWKASSDFRPRACLRHQY